MRKITVIFFVTFFAAAAVSAQGDIHSVDFKNFLYLPSCGGEDSVSFDRIRVKNGSYSKETQITGGYTEHSYFDVHNPVYGDVTGDGKDEAVILSVCNTGGTGQFTEGFIYGIKAGKPALIARIPGGDRADGGLRSITVNNGLIVVEANDPDKAAGACCPEGIYTQKYRLSGTKLIEVGAPAKRDLYPKERIAFAKGTSGKTFTVTIAPSDRKRYIVGARSGQTMSVAYTGPGDLDLRLLDDDSAEVTQAAHKIDAVLKRNGDFTFEISNYGAKPVTVTVTVRIR